jgi:hypothetical protein
VCGVSCHSYNSFRALIIQTVIYQTIVNVNFKRIIPSQYKHNFHIKAESNKEKERDTSVTSENSDAEVKEKQQISEEILRMILLEKLFLEGKLPRKGPIVVDVGLDDEHLSEPDREKHEKLTGELKQDIKSVKDDIKDLQNALKQKC